MKVKDLKQIIEKLDDNVELYYPHYYKGYGLIPVRKLDLGDIDGVTVGVFDWATMLLDDDNFIGSPEETREQIAKRLQEKQEVDG
jgi:hypothetical protein